MEGIDVAELEQIEAAVPGGW